VLDCVRLRGGWRQEGCLHHTPALILLIILVFVKACSSAEWHCVLNWVFGKKNPIQDFNTLKTAASAASPGQPTTASSSIA
jgi:hypothetical protein